MKKKLKPEDCPTWLYNGREFTEAPEDMAGFVYLIEEIDTGKKYIGKKNFWAIKKLPPLKGRKNKRHKKVESDWRIYFGSNNVLSEKVKPDTTSNFKRTILHLCKSKGMMSYMETHEQLQRRVLFDDTYYNSFIGCKIHESHVTGEK